MEPSYRLQLVIVLFSIIISSLQLQTDSSKPPAPVGGLRYLYTNTSSTIQQNAVEALIARFLPDRHTEFIVRINPDLTPTRYQDAFTITYDSGNDTGTRRNTRPTVIITGTTGVTASYGFNHYLKHVCNAQVSWEGVQGLDTLPVPLPPPPLSLRTPVPLLDRFHYYLNTCTESYSMAWWNWTRYEREIDWMALHGVNLPLVAVGQEAIWWRVFGGLGFTDDELSRFITGPAFLAWWRIGNLQRWGGPLPTNYMNSRLKLLKRVVARMRSYGMLPVLPGFAGSVPAEIRTRFPNASAIHRGSWSHFNTTYSPWFLEPTDLLYARISGSFIQELEKEIGDGGDQAQVYAVDTFNENLPSHNSTKYLSSVANATYNALQQGRSSAVVWVLQAWMFNADREFWSSENVEAYLSGVDIGNLLILDLMADANPVYLRFDSFFGHSFIWCMLQNFGGASVLYGTMTLINVGIPFARNASRPGSMIGLGMAPEGIETNYVMYDFMADAMISSSSMIDTKSWITAYAQRRYGSSATANGTATTFLQHAWLTLESTVYNAYPWIRSNQRTILSARPALNRSEKHWYKLKDIVSVLGDFLSANESVHSCILFRYDLVDVARQFLQHVTEFMYKRVLSSYHAQNMTDFKVWSRRVLAVLDDLDSLLSTHSAFMVGTRVQAAEFWGTSNEERDLLRFNLLNQITLWGPHGEIIDYAAKQWAGVISHYVRPRWALFMRELKFSLATGKPFQRKKYNRKVLNKVEIPFTNSPSSLFPTTPSGDSVAEARRVYEKWSLMVDTHS